MSKIVSYIMVFVVPLIVIVSVFETYTQGEVKIIPRKLTKKEYKVTYYYMKTSSHPSDKIVYIDSMNNLKNFKDVIRSGKIDSWIIKDPKFSNKEYEKRILKRARELKSNLIIAILVARTQEQDDPEK